MPGPFDAIERFMEGAVEGTVQRLLGAKLQPVQIAKAAARRMGDQQVVGPYGPEVPNSYSVSLNPTDFERFARYQVALERELARYLAKHARDRGWRPVTTISVSLVADASAPSGRPRVLAQMLDRALDSSPADGSLAAPLERTVVQRRAAPETESESLSISDSRASLTGENGERFMLDRPVVRLGRALENDVVVPDTRVSRFHAEIRRERGQFVLHDLGSTNSTLVADKAVERRRLRNGETISLGGYELHFTESRPMTEGSHS